MAAEFRITTDDTEWDGVDSSGTMTATRYVTITADGGDQLTLAESNVVPQIGDAHPTHVNWVVDSIGKIQHADLPNEYRLSIKYRKASGSGVDVKYGNSDVKPWELGVLDFRISYLQATVPFSEYYDVNERKMKKLVNSAGQKITATGAETIVVLSFAKNFKIHGNKRQVLCMGDCVNAKAETVCGFVIPAYWGNLGAMNTEYHKIFNNDGKTVKYEYETVRYEVKIKINGTWEMYFLDVGSMAKFYKSGSTTEFELGPVFQYTPWTSKNPSQQMQTKPKFGSITDVVKAINAYREATGDKTGVIPYTELDNVPLDTDGSVYTAAIKGEAEYRLVGGLARPPISWAQYNIPKEL